MTIAIQALSHITLPVGDLEKAEQFYGSELGLTLRRRVHEHLAYALHGDATLDVFLDRERGFVPPKPHPHVAFEVTPEVLRAKKTELEATGLRIDGPRRLGPPGHASIYFTDPWGNLLELGTLAWEGEIPFGPPDLVALGRRD